MASNTGHISTLSDSLSGTADTDAEWMQDGTDVIHSGIINALNIANSGSFIASGFNITQAAGTTYTTYALVQENTLEMVNYGQRVLLMPLNQHGRRILLMIGMV